MQSASLIVSNVYVVVFPSGRRQKAAIDHSSPLRELIEIVFGAALSRLRHLTSLSRVLLGNEQQSDRVTAGHAGCSGDQCLWGDDLRSPGSMDALDTGTPGRNSCVGII